MPPLSADAVCTATNSLNTTIFKEEEEEEELHSTLGSSSTFHNGILEKENEFYYLSWANNFRTATAAGIDEVNEEEILLNLNVLRR